MGAPLVEQLASLGHQVVVLVRHSHADRENIHYISGNGYDDEYMRTSILTTHYDAIVDFLWYNEATIKSRVADLFTACDQYVCLSSAAVYADSDNVQTEEYPRFIDVLPKSLVDGNHQYHLEKARVEDVMRKQERKNWTIIRPHVTFNNGHLPLLIWGDDTWLFRTLNGHAFTLPKNLMHKRTNYTCGTDVAKMIVRLLGNEKALGETFNVVSDRIVDSTELLSMYSSILDKFGYPIKVVYEPNMERWCTAFPKSVDRIEYDRALNRTISNEKFKSLIGEVEYEPLEVSLERCVKDYIENWKHGIVPSLLVDRLIYNDRVTHDRTRIGEILSSKTKKEFLIKKYHFIDVLYHHLYPFYSKIKKKK